MRGEKEFGFRCMDKLAFKIQGMDCAEEVAILRRELRPLISEERLAFDVLNAKLVVDLDGLDAHPAIEEIQQAVRRTGMEAVPFDEFREGEADREMGIWSHRQREILCLAAGLFTALGFLTHVAVQGLHAALEGSETPGVGVPVAVAALYAAALLAGGWTVLPKAFFSARRLRADINLLMTLAAVGAVILGNWFEAASVIFLFAFAQLLEN